MKYAISCGCCCFSFYSFDDVDVFSAIEAKFSLELKYIPIISTPSCITTVLHSENNNMGERGNKQHVDPKGINNPTFTGDVLSKTLKSQICVNPLRVRITITVNSVYSKNSIMEYYLVVARRQKYSKIEYIFHYRVFTVLNFYVMGGTIFVIVTMKILCTFS